MAADSGLRVEGMGNCRFGPCGQMARPVGAGPARMQNAYWLAAGVSLLASARRFSTSLAPMAPGTRAPLAKISVGVPVILCLRPNARLRCKALVSQLDAGTGLSRTMRSCQAVTWSLEHQMLRDFSAESGLRMGYRNRYTVTLSTFCRSRSKRLQ